MTEKDINSLEHMPVVCFSAYSGTGKTTYLTALIAELKSRWLRVCAVKHDAHSLEPDVPGKDSWCFFKAGADLVALASHQKSVIFDNLEISLGELLAHIPEVDIVLVEGYGRSEHPTAGIFRSSS